MYGHLLHSRDDEDAPAGLGRRQICQTDYRLTYLLDSEQRLSRSSLHQREIRVVAMRDNAARPALVAGFARDKIGVLAH